MANLTRQVEESQARALKIKIGGRMSHPEVPPGRSEKLIPMVRENRGDLYIFPHETHQKFQPRHKLAAYERNLDWFRFWLQGFESGAAAKHRPAE